MAQHLRSHFIPSRLLWRRRQRVFDGAVTYERTTAGLAWAVIVGVAAWALRGLF